MKLDLLVDQGIRTGRTYPNALGCAVRIFAVSTRETSEAAPLAFMVESGARVASQTVRKWELPRSREDRARRLRSGRFATVRTCLLGRSELLVVTVSVRRCRILASSHG